MTETLVCLSPINRKTTKLMRAGKSFDNGKPVSDYPLTTHFKYAYEEFDDFLQYVDILEKYRKDGNYFIIRGQLIDGIDTSKKVYRLIEDKVYESGEIGYKCFEAKPAGNKWVMIDIDELPNRWGINPSNKAEMVDLTHKIVCDMLPKEFHEAAYYYQWSNSMAMDGTWDFLKIHLWFMFKQSYTDKELCQWAKTTEVDWRGMLTTQALYIADPILTNMKDPLGDWRGDACVDYCSSGNIYVDFAYEYVEEQEFKAREFEAIATTQEEWLKKGYDFLKINLVKASAPMLRIAEIGVGSRCHPYIVSSADSWIRSCGANPNREMWKELVRQRVRLSGNPHAALRSSDRYLNQIWQDAQKKYSPINPNASSMPIELLINPNKF